YRPTRGRATWKLPTRYSVARGSVDEVARDRHTMIRRKARYSRLCQTMVRTARRSLIGLLPVRSGVRQSMEQICRAGSARRSTTKNRGRNLISSPAVAENGVDASLRRWIVREARLTWADCE